MFETLTVEMHDSIGEIRLTRPEKLNALAIETLEELASAARLLDDAPDVKVVIVSSEGRAFSAGADLSSLASTGGRSTREVAEIGRRMGDAIEAMRALTIARIQGWCVGGGLVLAAACDLRVASEQARFSIPEVDLGMPLAWGGIPRLMREMGPALVKELVLTCRPFDAVEAKASGFLNRVVPEERLDEEVNTLAGSLASKARYALFSTKRQVNAIGDQMVGLGHSWSDADGLVTAFQDEECAEVRRRYMKARGHDSATR